MGAESKRAINQKRETTELEASTMKRFGQRFRILRSDAGQTHRELSNLLGIDFAVISKIENGIRRPPYALEVYSKLKTKAGWNQNEVDKLMQTANESFQIVQPYNPETSRQIIRSGIIVNLSIIPDVDIYSTKILSSIADKLADHTEVFFKENPEVLGLPEAISAEDV